MKILILASLFALTACNDKSTSGKLVTDTTPENYQIVSQVTYPSTNALNLNGVNIADLSNPAPVVSPYGTVAQGTTLNVITISGIQFLVYGEDGVFAAECEVDAAYPDHGPGHPKCEIAHAESYDRIILCSSTMLSTPILTAQSWPGVTTAMTDSSLGMECWVDGVKMLSKKIFTY
jgi:hypothetical protein